MPIYLVSLFLALRASCRAGSGWENRGRWTVPKKKEGGKASGWAPEVMPKHRKSLPNGRQQGGAFGAAHKGPALRAVPYTSPLGKLSESIGKRSESARKLSESANFIKIEPERAPEMKQKH